MKLLSKLLVLTLLIVVALLHSSEGSPFSPAAGDPIKFSSPVQFAADDGAPNTGELVLADIDNDSDLELIVGYYHLGVIRVFENDGVGHFAFAAEYAVATGCTGLTCGDLDGDGHTDLIVGMLPTNADSFFVMLNGGTGAFIAPRTIKTNLGPAFIQCPDLDGDGDLDLVVSNKISDNVTIFHNDGLANFTQTAVIPGANWVHGTTSGDWNHDGDVDLAYTDLIPSSVVVMYYDQLTSQYYEKERFGAAGGYAGWVVKGDWNHDGFLDLAVSAGYSPGQGNTGCLTVLTNNQDSSFAPTDTICTTTQFYWARVSDFNLDGNEDIVVGTYYTDSLFFLTGDGLGGFGELQPLVAGSAPWTMSVGDLDSDGDMDLVTRSSSTDSVTVLFNLQARPDTLRIGNPTCLQSLLPTQQAIPIYLDNQDTVMAIDIPLLYDWPNDSISVSFVGTRLEGRTGLVVEKDLVNNTLHIGWYDNTGLPVNGLLPVDVNSENTPICRIVVSMPYACLEDHLSILDTTTIARELGPIGLEVTGTNAVAIVPVMIKDSTRVRHFLQGDANWDQRVSISDAVLLIRHIFAGGPAPVCRVAADGDGNGILSISDVVRLINYIFGGGAAPGANQLCSFSGPLFKSQPASADLEAVESVGSEVKSMEITARIDSELQGVQLSFTKSGHISNITVTGTDPSLQVFDGFVDGEYRVGLVDLDGVTTLPAGEHQLLTISYSGDGELTLREAIVVDSDAEEMSTTIRTTKSHSSLPMEFALSQNEPNPFNPTTEISFSLPTAGNVKLSVFNILGEEVATLIDEARPAGMHTVTWKGTDNSGRQVASGVYLYRLTAAGFSGTKKMLLLK